MAIVNRTAAREIFGGRNVVGKRAQFGGPNGPFFTVVGVVGDIRDASLKSPPRPQIYLVGAADDAALGEHRRALRRRRSRR